MFLLQALKPSAVNAGSIWDHPAPPYECNVRSISAAAATAPIAVPPATPAAAAPVAATSPVVVAAAAAAATSTTAAGPLHIDAHVCFGRRDATQTCPQL